MKQDIDTLIMKNALQNFPNQFGDSIKLAEKVAVSQPIDKIVIAGMGGSAFPAAIVQTYLDGFGFNIPIIISRDYVIRTPVTGNTLVFISSYSGNTEETIYSLHDAMKKGCKLIAIAAEGMLCVLAKKYNIPLVKLPRESKDFQPRWSTGYFVGAFLTVLQNSELIPQSCRFDLIELEKSLKEKSPEKEAAELAEALYNRIPVIYTSFMYGESVARIIKIKLNENSKTQAFYNVFPELNHNEMIGFSNPRANYTIVLLRDNDDHPRIKKRMEIFTDFFKEYLKIPVIHIEIEGRSSLEKMFRAIYLFDWVSYLLAIKYGVDPTPVNLVEKFKSALGPYWIDEREYTQDGIQNE